MTINYIKITDDHTIPTSELYKRIKDKFSVWSYWNEKELDKEFPAPKETTTRCFAEQAESSDRKGESWDDMKDVHKDMMTFREYILFFIAYHKKTGNYPDEEGWTLFQDRLPGGRAAHGYWYPLPNFRGVGFRWGRSGGSDPGIGARLAISPEPSNLVPSAIKKVSTTYEIEGNRVEIQDGKVSLKTKSGRQDFVFQGSTPETCEKIARVLNESAKLARHPY